MFASVLSRQVGRPVVRPGEVLLFGAVGAAPPEPEEEEEETPPDEAA